MVGCVRGAFFVMETAGFFPDEYYFQSALGTFATFGFVNAWGVSAHVLQVTRVNPTDAHYTGLPIILRADSIERYLTVHDVSHPDLGFCRDVR